MTANSFISPSRPGLLIAGCCAAAAAKYIEPPFWIFYPPQSEPFGAGWNEARLLSSLSAVILVIFLIAGGSLGDFFGRRRLLLGGLAGAVAANGLLLLSAANAWHVVLRSLALISTALVLPLALAPLYIFYRGKERATAFAWYILVTTFASLLAGEQGQFFLNLLGWRWAYLVPMIIAAIAFILIYRNLPENYVREPHHPDALIHAGWTLLVLAVLYGVMQAGIVRGRFIPILVVAMIAGGIGLALVLWWEVKSPGNLFRSPAIRTRDMTMLIIMGALIQLALMGFYLPTFRYFDVVKGYGIWIRVLALAPILVGMLLALRIVGRIWNTRRVRRVMAVGLLLTALSIVLMAVRPLHTHYLIQVIPLALFGYSILSTKTVWTNVFFRTVIDDYIGLNAGINSATLQIGGALGAMLVGELTAQFGTAALQRAFPYASLAPAQLRSLFTDFLWVTLPTRELLNRLIGPTAWEIYLQAYATAYTATLLVVAGLCLLGALTVGLGMRRGIRYTDKPVEVDAGASVFEDV